MNTYNPWPYNPLQAWYYEGGATPREQTVIAAAQANPDKAAHIAAVDQFSRWLQASMPDFYGALNPSLLDPLAVVLSGSLAPSGAAKAGGKLAGLGMSDEDAAALSNVVTSPNDGYDSAIGSVSNTVSDWGKTLTNLASQYLQYDQQKQLVQLNITRAEKGLPPIDIGQVSPTVNVGVSPAVQNIMLYAVGGLVAVGLLSAFTKARK